MSRANESSLFKPSVFAPFMAATLIWGTTWFVIRDQLGVVPASWSVTYRFFVAAITMFVVVFVTRAPRALGGQGQILAILFGFVQFFINFNLVYLAEGHITSGLVAVLFALLLVPNAILARIALNTPLSVRFMIGSVVATIGVALLIIRELQADQGAAHDTLLGTSMTLLAVLSASSANVLQGTKRMKAFPMSSMLAWSMMWGAIMNAAYAYVTAGPPIMLWDARYIGGVTYLGIFASAFAFTCYFIVVRAVGPATAAYSSVITPIIAMVISTLFENYRWSAIAIAGGMVTLVGLLIALSAPKPATKSG